MIPRLYIDGPLHAGLPAPFSQDQAHYLKAVLRREVGDALLLFNGKDGEYAAEQCGRLTVPSVGEPIKLPALLEGWVDDRHLVFAMRPEMMKQKNGVGAKAGLRPF